MWDLNFLKKDRRTDVFFSKNFKKGQTDRRFFLVENTNARHVLACGKYTLYKPNQPKNPKTLIVNVFRTPILV
ncbi:hypothetical protein FRACYDRAFT_271115 [Fragilariopsis cylindrus CCMP1102]|uniref:Uncharacterized protein n=1 Tax=Fragilariopsis cylindrus CCMP1102 TaxID=635003 RepID=A0A1E7EX24_9STRA|nr:hypothetical protein FRACYDRAFT_271115 [Fragilariopsis cylindrus CCMP1102]|eukprot:OEU10364.1 hypothetical protein FRACYDRAFT_271115 [Fragilariopsis cylindrus CCMP1102]